MSMTIEQAVQKIYGRARGKDSLGTPLTAGDAKYNQILDIIDDLQKDWQNTEGINWNSLWQLFRLSSTVSATDTYALNALMRRPSDRENDPVIITDTSGNKYYYDMVTADQLREYQINQDRTICAVQGTNLVFAVPFKSTDKQFGGSIDVPGYGFVTDVNLSTNTASQKVQVDDPMWLIYMGAAEFVRTDLVRQNQYPNLVARAVDRMDSMISKNNAQLDEVPIDMDLADLDPNLSSGAWV